MMVRTIGLDIKGDTSGTGQECLQWDRTGKVLCGARKSSEGGDRKKSGMGQESLLWDRT